MDDENRKVFKVTLGIFKTTSKNNCRNCHYRPLDDICNKHFIKTDNKEACDLFKRDIKWKFVSGGRMSPR